jgi:hypothetical protein
VQAADTYKYPGHEHLQLTTDASGAEVVMIKQALPLVVVSTMCYGWYGCTHQACRCIY